MKSVDRHTFRASPTATVTVLALVQLLSAFAFLIRSDCMAGERETPANATNSLQDIRRGFATHLIRSPTFVFEGTEQRSNIDSVMALSRASGNPLVHFHPVKGANQWSYYQAKSIKQNLYEVARDQLPKASEAPDPATARQLEGFNAKINIARI